MARITERRNLSNWLPDFSNLTLIPSQYLFMHTTSCALERNRSKWNLTFAKNCAKLRVDSSLQMMFLSENHVFTDLSEAEMLDLSLEDDDWMHRNVFFH